MKYHIDFLNVQKINNQVFSDYLEHYEASKYQGCEYNHNDIKFVQRTAKITPKKVGQFVTLWKRNSAGVTSPYDKGDIIDFIVIVCRSEEKIGRFLFPKLILQEKKLISNISKGIDRGKRGFRVYPLWDRPTSKQALKTQIWQTRYFRNDLLLNI